MKKSLILALLATAFNIAVAGAAEPYENSSVVGQVQDRIMVVMKPGVNLTVQKSAGVPKVGIQAMDALALQFDVHKIEGLYAGLTKNLAKSSRDDLDRVFTIDFGPDVALEEIKAAYEKLPDVEEVQLVDICKM